MEKRRIHTGAIKLAAFGALLAIFNIHLFQGVSPSDLIYRPEAVLAGQWWRVFTHFLVHVSWYHLLLDAGAVALLWSELKIGSLWTKVAAVSLCAAGSLIVATGFSPYISQTGLCGFSGMAHGMMFLLGLWWIRWASTFWFMGYDDVRLMIAGGVMILASGGKSIIEIVTGKVIFAGLHMGDIGLPIVHAHLGGVLGGLLAFILLTARDLLPCTMQSNYRIEEIRTHETVF